MLDEQLNMDLEKAAENHVDLRALELEKDFTYDGYQVVRRELFAHLREPAVVIRKDSITFNTACINGMEDVIYVQILINPDTKKMVVRRCNENDKDALRWCIAKPDKRKSRKVTSKIFSAKIYEMMGWNAECRYKMLGHKISIDDEMIYIFELDEPEIFIEKKRKKKKTDGEASADENVKEELTPEEKKNYRKPYYPEEWKDSFGLPVEEHKVALDVDIKNGYAEFSTSTN